MRNENLKSQVMTYADRHRVGSDPYPTEVPGLSVIRSMRPTPQTLRLYQPILCLVLQGAKETTFGNQIVTFSENASVIISLEMPNFVKVVRASPDRPYLALSLQIDIPLLKEVAAELGDLGNDPAPAQAVAAGAVDGAILNAMERLFALRDNPAAAKVLLPLILREIHFWMLSASHGNMLRRIVQNDNHAARISEAAVHIRRHFKEVLKVPDLARAAGMSASAFYQEFKAVCGTTPLQFQKKLRLMEARRLLAAENYSVSTAALTVGYESATQFSREFARLFGMPPQKHRLIQDAADFGIDRKADGKPKSGDKAIAITRIQEGLRSVEA